MLPLVFLLALSLPQVELEAFARRVAQALAQSRERVPADRVLLRVEDPGGLGAVGQIARALQEALVQEGFQPMAQGAFRRQVVAYLSLRRGRPLAVVRILDEDEETTVLFAEFSPGREAEAAQPERPPMVIRTRTLLSADRPVLDLEADADGNLFVLHPDRLAIFDLNAAGLPLKAEVQLDTGAERLRDPLARLLARQQPRQLELYSAAETLAPPPLLTMEGYTLRSFPASAPLRLAHPWRNDSLELQFVAGKNFLRSGSVADLYGLAPVLSPLSAHWVLLDRTGNLVLTDPKLQPVSVASGPFGGDVASVTLPCAGTVVMAAGPEAQPRRDRITVFRVGNDRLLSLTSLELEGAIRRLRALPPTGEVRRILAVAETNQTTRIEEIELRCAP